MRISLFTRRLEDARKRSQLAEAAAAAAEHGAAMVVLPGWSVGRRPGKGRRGAQSKKRRAAPRGASARFLQQLADESGLSLLAEIRDTWCFVPEDEPIGPFVQRFATSAEATRRVVAELTEGYLDGRRSIHLEHTCVRVLLCGESNVLRNVRDRDYAAGPRYPDLGWDLKYDVLVNPAHTSMGQWHLLHRRLAYLSQGGRTALYCTNNTHAAWRSALCVYRDGDLVTMGDLAGAADLPHHIADAWRLVTVDVPPVVAS
jgi:hypothetical protein